MDEPAGNVSSMSSITLEVLVQQSFVPELIFLLYFIVLVITGGW
jgi:hypothetical protein